MRRSRLFFPLLLLFASMSCASGSPGDCEWCAAHEAPADVAHAVVIADRNEPGERLQLQGTVYLPDATTPAPGVLIYLYHTDARGRYPRRGGESGQARRHGYLRGWVLTDAQGRYTVDTIRPGSYPGRTDPAHIHATVRPPGQPEYWLEGLYFAGDPELTDAQIAKGGVITLQRDATGGWRGVHDVVLKADSRPWR